MLSIVIAGAAYHRKKGMNPCPAHYVTPIVLFTKVDVQECYFRSLVRRYFIVCMCVCHMLRYLLTYLDR